MADPDAALHAAVPGKYKPAQVPAPTAGPAPTGTLFDVIERGPDLAPHRGATTDDFTAPPSWSQMFTAARPEALRSTPLYDDVKVTQGYAPIIDALGLPASENPGYFGALDPAGEARFGSVGSPSRLATSARRGEQLPFSDQYLADRAIQESLVIDQIRARRAKDPNFLPGVPDTAEGLHQYFEQQQAKQRAAGSAVLARGSTFGRVTAGLAAGGLESAIHDPITLPTLVLGGGTASSVLQAAGRDALINGVLSLAEQPIVEHNMAENNEHLTVGDVVSNVASSAAFGAAVGTTVHVSVAHVPPALFKIMPESVQRRWADRMKVGGGKDAPLLKDVLGDMNNRELAGFARSAIGDKMTPDEKAAANVIERSQELGEASPFVDSPEGRAAHGQGLAQALQSIIDNAPLETSRSSLLASSSPIASRSPVGPGNLSAAAVPHDIVAFFKGKGATDAQAYGIAAGIVAESRASETALGPAVTRRSDGRTDRAFGLGQHLFERKDELLRRYGPHPTREQQLENLWRELTGGDPGGAAVLAGKDPATVLDAYIRKFMRPHAGAETVKDLERGMDALGRHGEVPDEGATAAAGGDDDAAAIAAQAAGEREAIDLARSREAPELGERSPAREADSLPILKRELFPNDDDWFAAQVAFYRSLDVENAPRSPAEGPPASEAAAGPAEVAAAPAAAPGEDITVESYVDAYLRGEGRGDSPRDRELLQFATNNGPAIEAEFQRRTPIARFRAEAAQVEATLPPVEPGQVRLWRGARSTERGAGLNFTTDLAGIALPFRNAYGGELRYIDLPESDLAGFTMGAGATDAEFHLPAEVAAKSTPVTDRAPPEQIRIDDPELEAFDDGGRGRADQVESLEHDLRMQADEQAAAHLERRFAELGPAPRRPPTFIQSIGKILGAKSKAAGIRYRIDADDAISHGVDADSIYINPKARYPVVKLQLAGIFAASKAPLRSKASATKLVSLDWFGDRVDPASFGLNPELGRLEPEDVADLLRASIEKSTDAFDRSDPNYRPYLDWVQQHDGLMALTGEAAHPVTGETMPEAQRRGRALRDSYPPVEPGGAAGTHNIPNSAEVPTGGTRGELRAEIFKQLLAKPARAGREAYIVLGPPAAGKSTVAEALAEKSGARLIDADEAKALLPEYDNGIGAEAVHEESSRLAAVAADASIRKGENVVLPVVGRTYEGASARIDDLLAAGYKVHLALVDLPVEKAVERATARFAQTGRLVDPNYVRMVGDTPRENFARLVDTYKDRLGGYAHVSNDVPQGQRPRLVEASDAGLADRLGSDRAAGAGEGPRAAQGGSEGDAGAAPGQELPELGGRRYQLTADGQPQALAEIFAELDGDRAAVDALRACATAKAAA
jgi:predicted kinase